MDFSPAEMLCGSSLRLPGEFLSPQKEQSYIEYVQQLRSFVQNLKPTPVRKSTPSSVYIDRKLSACSHVFVRHDAVKIGLQRPYDGPYKVFQRTDKYFKINLNGIVDNVSVDRLKPATPLSDFEKHTLSDNQTKKLQRSSKYQQLKHKMPFHFTDHSQVSRKPTTVFSTGKFTRKGREIHEPNRFHL